MPTQPATPIILHLGIEFKEPDENRLKDVLKDIETKQNRYVLKQYAPYISVFNHANGNSFIGYFNVNRLSERKRYLDMIVLKTFFSVSEVHWNQVRLLD